MTKVSWEEKGYSRNVRRVLLWCSVVSLVCEAVQVYRWWVSLKEG